MELRLTKNFKVKDGHRLEVSRAQGGYQSLTKLFQMKPEDVIAQVKEAGLRGRGGAGFSAGLKWIFIPKNSGKPVYLTVNADESEPGTFKDRYILELDPHLLIEGIIATCYAIGAHVSYVYIRGEFYFPMQRLQAAIDGAYQAGLLGKNILNSGFDLQVYIHRGAGAYICGEETALLESIEGKRGQPRLKPPYPAIVGLFGCPTIINNVETISSVPYIIQNGVPAYRALGTQKSPGTKLFCVSGHVVRPGNYERPLGYPLKSLIFEDCGGIQGGKKLKAVIPGGSSMPLLDANDVETVLLDYESMEAHGSMLGSGGVIVMDETTNMVEALGNLAHFYAHESCGQCSPCREGTGWAAKILDRMLSGEGRPKDLELLRSIADNMAGKTICVLADSLSMPIWSYMKKFKGEFEAYANPNH